MSNSVARLKAQARKANHRATQLAAGSGDRLFNGKKLTEYRDDPEGYAKYVLKVVLTPAQLRLCQLITTFPYRVLCRAGHVVGKSFAAAFLVSWLYDTRPECIIITTAPTFEGVKDIVWRELRKLRRRAGLGGFAGPKVCRLESSDSHFAVGITARDATAFQGKHDDRVFVIIDEAVGVDPEFWEAIETMLTGEEYGLFAIYNPTSTACQAYLEEQEGVELPGGEWQPRNHIVTMSSLDHPNIAAELRGERPPYPAAIRLETIRTWITKWCDLLQPGDEPTEYDFQFPPPGIEGVEPGPWYRPGLVMEARGLGRWPRQGVDTVWSEVLFERCVKNRQEIEKHWRTVIGCDVARYGDDLTEIVIRTGASLVHHEFHSGWNGLQIAKRLKILTHEYCGPEEPRAVRVYVDETGGWGSSVIDASGDYNFLGVNVSCKAMDEEEFDDLRTELWMAAEQMASGKRGLDFSRLSQESRKELKRQLTAQKYKINPKTGRILCLDKDKMKDILKRSPDTADAFNLCCLVDYQPREQDAPMHQTHTQQRRVA